MYDGKSNPSSFSKSSESFVAQFVINTKVLKGMSSLITLWKGKNKMLYNYSKRYWELYNKIQSCLEELTVRMTMSEKLWDDLTLNP